MTYNPINFNNGKAGGTPVSASNLRHIENGIVAAHNDIAALTANVNSLSERYGTPLVAHTAAEMTDNTKIYVYVGSETGYTTGDWYYYDGDSWESGGAYNSTAVNTDTTLTQEDMAADAKKVGDELSDLKSAIEQGGGGLTADVKAALDQFTASVLQLAEKVAYIDEYGQDYYDDIDDAADALHSAMNPPVNLASISAVYTQSGKTVYDTDTLDDLKTDLVVTAHYDNGTSGIVTTYTLSGTLTAGTSTITVSYGGKTTSFNVAVTASPLPSGYAAVPWVASLNTGTTGEYRLDTGVAPSANGTIDVEIGFMVTSETSANKYFITSNQGTGAGAVGFGVCVGADNHSVSAYNGIAATINPNGTNSLLNEYVEITAHMASGTASITDGTLTDTKTGTGRQHTRNIFLFGLASLYNGTYEFPAKGRIYYVRVKDNDTLILDLLPCVRTSDDAAGFYDTVNETFITSSYLTAGE